MPEGSLVELDSYEELCAWDRTYGAQERKGKP